MPHVQACRLAKEHRIEWPLRVRHLQEDVMSIHKWLR